MFDSYSERQRDRRPGVAIACIAGAVVVCGVVVANQRASQRERDSATMNAAVAMAPDPVAAWHRLELPGMSLEIPDELTVTGDYARGLASSFAWAVSWQPGSLPPVDLVEQIVKQMAVTVHGSASKPSSITILGKPGYEAELTLPQGPAIVSLTECGGRVVQLIGGASRAIVERARASLRCTPKADAELSDRIAVELRPGWHRTGDGAPLTLANDDQGALLSIAAQDAREIDVAAAARASHFDVSTDPVMHGAYAVRRGTVTTGHVAPAAIVTWRCSDPSRGGMIFVAELREGGLENGIELAETGRCLEPGESLPSYPLRAR